MLEIYICEDQKNQREQMISYVKKATLMKNWDTQIVCVTASPDEILEHVKVSNNTGIYFLDIELGASMTGVELASEIRKFDPRGFIVLVTTHSEYMALIFKYKLEVLDFIQKEGADSIKDQVESCLCNAWDKYTRMIPKEKKMIQIKNDSGVLHLPSEDIYYIDTIKGTHYVCIHTESGTHDIRSCIDAMLSQLPDYFTRVHNSYIVNRHHIVKIDYANHVVLLEHNIQCPLSIREGHRLKKLEKQCNHVSL